VRIVARLRRQEHEKEESVRKDVGLMLGLAIGAGTMFLLDPDRGRRLRSRFDDVTRDTRLLADRVRAELGRVVSHPHAVAVSIPHAGCVCLSGPILSSEADMALAAVAGVRGVATVSDDLERHDTPEGVPALQGGHFQTVRRTGPRQRSWSPRTKLMVALTGTAMAASVTYAMRGASPAPRDTAA
jgi:hypothetical protein